MQVSAPGQGLRPALPQGGELPLGSQPPQTTSFQDYLVEVNRQQRRADTQVRQSLTGEGELHEAMLALEKANLSLRLLVQVRNKLVAAYEDLSRMPM